jgi:DNA replication protein DnaC
MWGAAGPWTARRGPAKPIWLSPWASEQGYGVYFVNAHALVEDLRAAMAEHRLERRMRVYLAFKPLIIDEFGVWPCDQVHRC